MTQYNTGYRPERQSRVNSKLRWDSNYERAFGKFFTCVCGAKHKLKAIQLPAVCGACSARIEEKK